MVFADVGDAGYNVLLFLHILAVMAAYAPAFVHPIIGRQSKSLPADQHQVLGYIAKNGQRIYAVALIVGGLLGFGVVGMSGDTFSLGDGWLIAAIIVWVAMNGVLHALLIPAERAWAGGDDAAEPRVAAGGAAMTALLLVMLYLMVWQPGA